jgi:hypothetical protein
MEERRKRRRERAHLCEYSLDFSYKDISLIGLRLLHDFINLVTLEVRTSTYES